MLPLLILSAKIDEMIKNPALKLKNRLFNLNVLLALYLEHFFLSDPVFHGVQTFQASSAMLKESRLHPQNLVTMSHS